YGLSADGIAGPGTLTAIEKALKGEIKPIPPTPPIIDDKDAVNKFSKINFTIEEAITKQMMKNPQIQRNGKWVSANKSEVTKYVNPTNYNSGIYKYQFLILSGSSGIKEKDMKEYLSNKGILDGTEKYFIDAAKENNISEVYLAGHACLETGNGTSELAKGVVVKGVKVYNFFGINAIDGQAVKKGSEFAYEQGWSTPEKAIYGGAKFISKRYINSDYKQDTLYKMRWNPSDPGKHQYATDIAWAINQTRDIKKMYDSFKNIKLVFDIPVYKGQSSDENASNLEKYIKEYTDFSCDGVKVKIPYYITPSGTTLYGGKKTPDQIKAYLRANASSPSEYQECANKNKRYTGVDCSGFTAYVLNETTNGRVLKYWNTTYANGISAANLTSSSNGVVKSKAKDIVPGCTIRTDNGGHVIVIYKVIKNKEKVTEIHYAHSNGSKGPHEAYIMIGNENQDLDGNEQTWYDIAYTDAKAKALYNHTILLNCVQNHIC
ncbi:N-acetylglucosaminidase, partial [Anaerophilus nitritogenes]|uniref:N-acetylglucosaminidase n=1 Tax=Anaerophilus nitritogenes TaxID=2498136 RepID=UPI00193107A4